MNENKWKSFFFEFNNLLVLNLVKKNILQDSKLFNKYQLLLYKKNTNVNNKNST